VKNMAEMAEMADASCSVHDLPSHTSLPALPSGRLVVKRTFLEYMDKDKTPRASGGRALFGSLSDSILLDYDAQIPHDPSGLSDNDTEMDSCSVSVTDSDADEREDSPEHFGASKRIGEQNAKLEELPRCPGLQGSRPKLEPKLSPRPAESQPQEQPHDHEEACGWRSRMGLSGLAEPSAAALDALPALAAAAAAAAMDAAGVSQMAWEKSASSSSSLPSQEAVKPRVNVAECHESDGSSSGPELPAPRLSSHGSSRSSVQEGEGERTAGAAAVPGESASGVQQGIPQASKAQGSEPHTTVMLRNLPNNYTRAMVLAMIDGQGFKGTYDFLYVPIDFRTKAGLGYAFVNLVGESLVPFFWATFDGFAKWVLPSSKVCSVNWSGPHQGQQAHVERYRNSPIMHSSVPDDYKPMVFATGVRSGFPPPTKKLRAPRHRNAA